ncbi:MAG TPA: phytanoyl-CoA dioxygenase family protein, partial [Polyangiaceae bacterium]
MNPSPDVRSLGADQVEGYRRHGIVFPIRVMSREKAAQYRERCDELESLLGGSPRTIEVRQMHLHFRWAYELCVEPAVLDAVSSVLGPNLLVWATELFAKKARDPNLFIAWHRDSPYMGFDPRLTATAWISLARSFRENGCLQVVLEEDRRTSKLGKEEGGRREQAGPGPGISEDRVTNVELEPGQMSIHDVDVYHGSGPNLSGEKRVGFAVRFITPEARA